jgi:hypothetical protein
MKMGSMWKPKTAGQVFEALADLQESEVFDAKAAVPAANKASDFAVDVAAMANDGGSIVYGIAEDKSLGAFVAAPISLAGQSERLSDVVNRLIQDPPRFQVWDIPLPDDPAHGFLVMAVPPSPLAPHMVKNAFWGRAGTINVKLSQGVVDRLYARRRSWEQDGDAILQTAINDSVTSSTGRGDLVVVVHPLLGDSRILNRSGLLEEAPFRQALVANTTSVQFKMTPPWSSGLSILVNGRFRPTIEGVAFQLDGLEDGHHYRLEIQTDGTARFHWSGLLKQHRQRIHTTLHEATCAQFTARVLALAGRFLLTADYDGPVTAALCVRGTRGAVSEAWHDPDSQQSHINPVPDDDYRRMARVDSYDLLGDTVAIAKELIGPLLRVVRPGDAPDPLAPT